MKQYKKHRKQHTTIQNISNKYRNISDRKTKQIQLVKPLGGGPARPAESASAAFHASGNRWERNEIMWVIRSSPGRTPVPRRYTVDGDQVQ